MCVCVCGGVYTGFTLSVSSSVCPSICVRHHVCSLSYTILAGSISYLYTISSNFGRCVTCYFLFLNSKIWIFGIFFLNCKFRFVLFWLGMKGIWYIPIVWIVMGWPMVFSECRCSSCFSFDQNKLKKSFNQLKKSHLKMHLKILSSKWWTFCSGYSVLNYVIIP